MSLQNEYNELVKSIAKEIADHPRYEDVDIRTYVKQSLKEWKLVGLIASTSEINNEMIFCSYPEKDETGSEEILLSTEVGKMLLADSQKTEDFQMNKIIEFVFQKIHDYYLPDIECDIADALKEIGEEKTPSSSAAV